MTVDLKLMKQALDELGRLRRGAMEPPRFLAHLYAAALAEWAGQLGVDPFDLHRLVHVREEAGAHARRSGV